MTKTKKSIVLTILIVLAGFLREYVFYNINWIFKTLTEGRMNQAREEFYFLLEWNPDSIVILKWLLTVLFYGLFTWLTYLIINTYFQNKLNNQITLFVFAFLLALSGVLYVIGYLFGISGSLYHVIRTLMGLGQSFMPLMILFVAFKFLPQKASD